MADDPKTFDVWFVAKNTVYKDVPFQVVTDWVQQSRLSGDDMVKPTGTLNWSKITSLPLFQAYLIQPREQEVGDIAAALEPIEMDFNWKRRYEDDDEDVDMIPLIDISLVLLIFFMMTTTVSAISRILVPSMANATKIESSVDVLCLYIDKKGDAVVYGIGKGTEAPADENDNLADEKALFNRLDAVAQSMEVAPEVRIAAHGDLPYETVESIMKQLDRRHGIDKGQISKYTIEVNEKARR